jgi:phage-related protein
VYKIKFYKDEQGFSDVIDMLEKLRAKSQTSKTDRINLDKINHYITALSKQGTALGMPIVRNLGDGLWELRPNANRILFFYFQNNEYVILSHFIKKTNATPPLELKKAKRRMKNHIERFGSK